MMNRSVVLATLLALPALAHADEIAAPGVQPVMVPMVAQPAPPAPQTDDWSNVSHINGQIVKVGERTDYLIENRQHTNISGNPFGPFWGYYDVAVAHKLSQNLAVSGSLAGWSRENGDHTGYQATVTLPLYFKRTFSGPFLEPGLIMRSTSYNDSYALSCSSCSDYSNTRSWVGPELLFGWQWTFDSGLNVAAALGVAKHMTDKSSDMETYSSSEPDFNGYFRVGYAF